MPSGPPWAPGEGRRLAYDPHKGRLWHVCPDCRRWVLTPLEDRWETLQACEDAVKTLGKVLLSTPHLSLIELPEGELIRVGEPPRLEFVDWRYGPRLGDPSARPGFWARLLSRLPPPPIGGYDPYRGFQGALESEPWFASPFLDKASLLTYLFSQVPLAPRCPSCGGPVALKPWDFQNLRFVLEAGLPAILTTCGLCGTEVAIRVEEARPTLRMGLSLVTDPGTLQRMAEGAASALDSAGGAGAFLRSLVLRRPFLGELSPGQRAGLIITLDEVAELDALEARWREAEEMAAIMDGELSDVPGFETFRREILDDLS